MFNQSLFDRLYARVFIHPETGCHLWQGSHDGKDDPYGRISIKGATIATHIAMWRILKGKIRKGYQIDHKCTNRLCVNITHLQEVTNLKNQRLRVKRSKHKGNVIKCLEIR